MLSVSISKINFDQLSINNITKRGIFESLKTFWNGNENEYIEYLEKIGINYYAQFSNIYTFNQSLNEDIEKISQAFKNDNIGKFDPRSVSLIANNNRYLKSMTDNDYFSLNIDLRNLNNKDYLTEIKDIFLNTDSCSLVDFKEISENRLSLIYHKKGVINYWDKFIIANARDKIQIIESFQEPKDNNFIIARFVLDMSKKLKEENIDESFCYSYETSNSKKEVIKDVDEIIYWGSLNLEEKSEQLSQEKIKNENNVIAKEIANNELKKENNEKRNSLKSDSNKEIIENSKNTKLFNINSIENEENFTEDSIDEIVNRNFEIYSEKEIEKTKIRLEKAKKESYQAYEDLKISLENGSSILDGIKIIQQKYRNEDTINFASLLFAKDILNINLKEKEILKLKDKLLEEEEKQKKLEDEITKREESLSSIKGTLQSKINEMSLLREQFEEELEQYKGIENQVEILNKELNKRDEQLNDLNNENQDLYDKNNEQEKKIIVLENNLSHLNNMKKEYDEQNKKSIELQIENGYLKELMKEAKNKENQYEEKIKNLENKINEMFNTFVLNKTNEEQKNIDEVKKIRSSDILRN